MARKFRIPRRRKKAYKKLVGGQYVADFSVMRLIATLGIRPPKTPHTHAQRLPHVFLLAIHVAQGIRMLRERLGRPVPKFPNGAVHVPSFAVVNELGPPGIAVMATDAALDVLRKTRKT